jgi:hypothetical protein
MDIKDIGWEAVKLIHFDRERDQWQPLLITVVNLWVT